MACKIFHSHKGHQLAFGLGQDFLHGCDQHGAANLPACRKFTAILKPLQAQTRNLGIKGLQRMAGKIKTESLLFGGAQHIVRKFRQAAFRQVNPKARFFLFRLYRRHGQQGSLGGCAAFGFFLGPGRHNFS